MTRAIALAALLVACRPQYTPANPGPPPGANPMYGDTHDVGVCDRDLRARVYFNGLQECQDALEGLADSDEDYFTDNCQVCDGRIVCEIFTWDGDVVGACVGD